MAKTQDPTDMGFLIACIKGDQLQSNVQLTLDKGTAANYLWNMIVVSESQREKAFEGGAIPGLCSALIKGDAMCKHYCAGCLHYLAIGSREMKEEIINGKAIPALAQVLRHGTDNAAKSAAYCLFEILKDPVLVKRVGLYADVILPPLTYLVEENQRWSVGPAAGSLWLLSKDPGVSRRLLQAGIVPLLVKVLKTGETEEGRSCASGTLCNMMEAEEVKERVADQFIAEGGLPPVAQLLESGSPQGQANAAGCLFTVAKISKHVRKIAKCGAIPHLVEVVGVGMDEGKMCAAGALWFAAMRNEKVCMEIAVAGGVTPLVKLLASKDEETRFNAQGCLRNMCMVDSVLDVILEAHPPEHLTNVWTPTSILAPRLARASLRGPSAVDENLGAALNASEIEALLKSRTSTPAPPGA